MLGYLSKIFSPQNNCTTYKTAVAQPREESAPRRARRPGPRRPGPRVRTALCLAEGSLKRFYEPQRDVNALEMQMSLPCCLSLSCRWGHGRRAWGSVEDRLCELLWADGRHLSRVCVSHPGDGTVTQPWSGVLLEKHAGRFVWTRTLNVVTTLRAGEATAGTVGLPVTSCHFSVERWD